MLKAVYSAPNRAHHYGYARNLHQADMLEAFVCAFPRLSPRSPILEIGNTLKRVDLLQTIYVSGGKFGFPRWLSDELGYWSKIRLDQASRQPLKNADIFLFYNGAGLNSARWFRQHGGITIVEAVNCHVQVQEALMREEHLKLGLPWHPFHVRETRRRVQEVEEADYILLPSTFVARSFLAKGIPAQRLLKVPYPTQKISGASASETKTKADNVFRVLYVGTISVRKGLRYLIEAFRQLKHPHKELWIVGPKANPSGIDDLAIPEGVTFTGPLKGNDLQNAYQQATVFCLPSIEEGQALVLSEALSYGLPVIATENTGIEDLLRDGQGGMVVPIRDAEAIAGYLTRLVEDTNFMFAAQQAAKQAGARLSQASTGHSNLVNTLEEVFNAHTLRK